MRKRDPDYIETITYITRRRLTSYLKDLDVIIFDHRLLAFYQRFHKEIANPESISARLPRIVYKAAKALKITAALEFSEKWRFRLKNRWIFLVVIKKPYEVKTPLLEEIRVI